ncbi:transcription elongation regulator 1-like isoform X2 [Ceratina calcarata]|uniref:Transcription elongation regulator 1-like isoform X2 n=1 Tax=Ceratina calcarata TaxID=156304 RepID=A0AAJ7NB00_9HYME|nr:transcription elongation regulator 1-like isoform X2 [Ceratina calcarata]
MWKYLAFFGIMFISAFAEPPVQGVRATNVLGTSDQHASFSFVRPGLTQTAFAFSGPSSHQSFSSNIGNPYLAQRVLPNIASALAYRNPGLGVFPTGSIAHGYATAPVAGPTFVSAAQAPLPYQASIDPATLAYYQQLQQIQQPQVQAYSAANAYQAQLAQLLAYGQAQAQAQAQAQSQEHVQSTQAQVPEQIQLQQEEQQQEEQQSQNLLGVAYSSAPSVARVKVSGNGYKFNF